MFDLRSNGIENDGGQNAGVVEQFGPLANPLHRTQNVGNFFVHLWELTPM